MAHSNACAHRAQALPREYRPRLSNLPLPRSHPLPRWFVLNHNRNLIDPLPPKPPRAPFRVGPSLSVSPCRICRTPVLATWIEFQYILEMSVKEQVLQAIQRLPDDIDFRDVADEIALLAAIQDAERDIQTRRLRGGGPANAAMKCSTSERSTLVVGS